MFKQLSEQSQVLTSLRALPISEFTVAKKNLTKLIQLLSVDAVTLLANKRNFGALLTCEATMVCKQLPLIELSTLLINEEQLTTVINTLCLTEAIIVRDNFSNVLEEVSEAIEVAQSLTKSTVVKAQVPKNNIAPIHLVDVKQRLAQALQVKAEQRIDIKNKLNSLLEVNTASHLSKQA